MRMILNCLIPVVLAVPAFAAYTTDYLITLPGSGVITASQTNFPVLVCANLTLGNGNVCLTITALKSVGNGGSVQSSTGLDIVPSSTGCGSPTLLNWELVSGVYSQSTGALEMWVQIPTLSASGTFHLCIGNASPPSSPGSAWNSNYGGVWHFPNGTSALSLADSTSNGNTGTAAGSGTVPTYTSGQIDGGALISGGAQIPYSYVNVPSSSSLSPTGDRTISMWFNLLYAPGSSGYAYPVLIGKSSGNGYTDMYSLLFTGGQLFFSIGNAASNNYYLTTTATSKTFGSGDLGTWYYVCATLASGTAAIYLNGSAMTVTGSSASGSPQTNTAALTIGVNHNVFTGGNSNFDGDLDEVRVMNASVGSAWASIEYANQSAPATFLTWALQISSSIHHKVIGGAN